MGLCFYLMEKLKLIMMINNLTKFFHADDYGYSESISNNILDCVDNGPINSVSIMINSEDYF